MLSLIILLISLTFPFLGSLIGSLFDYKSRLEGNFRYDLPSTLGLLIGFAFNFYLNWYFEQLTLLISFLLTLYISNHIDPDNHNWKFKVILSLIFTYFP